MADERETMKHQARKILIDNVAAMSAALLFASGACIATIVWVALTHDDVTHAMIFMFAVTTFFLILRNTNS